MVFGNTDADEDAPKAATKATTAQNGGKAAKPKGKAAVEGAADGGENGKPKKNRPSGMKYNTQAKRNASVLELLLSTMEEGDGGAEGGGVKEGLAKAKELLHEGKDGSKGGKKKAVAKPATTPKDQAEASSSGSVASMDLGGGKTVGDLLTALEASNKLVQQLQEKNTAQYQQGFEAAVNALKGAK